MRALKASREWPRVTLASIGDALITTDLATTALTGWTLAAAADVPLERVFRIIHDETRETVDSPRARALRKNVVVGLANHTLLIAKDGAQRAIDDRAASTSRGCEPVLPHRNLRR